MEDQGKAEKGQWKVSERAVEGQGKAVEGQWMAEEGRWKAVEGQGKAVEGQWNGKGRPGKGSALPGCSSRWPNRVRPCHYPAPSCSSPVRAVKLNASARNTAHVSLNDFKNVYWRCGSSYKVIVPLKVAVGPVVVHLPATGHIALSGTASWFWVPGDTQLFGAEDKDEDEDEVEDEWEQQQQRSSSSNSWLAPPGLLLAPTTDRQAGPDLVQPGRRPAVPSK